MRWLAYADDVPASSATLPASLPRIKVVWVRNVFLKVASKGNCSCTPGDKKDPNFQHPKQVLQPASSGDLEPLKDNGGLATESEKPHCWEAGEGVVDIGQSELLTPNRPSFASISIVDIPPPPITGQHPFLYVVNIDCPTVVRPLQIC
jgi:hypothetical protein